jgi:hypothetical protein
MKARMCWKLNSGNPRNMHRSLLGKLLRRWILGGQKTLEVNEKLREIHFEEESRVLMLQNCVRWRFLSLMCFVFRHFVNST